MNNKAKTGRAAAGVAALAAGLIGTAMMVNQLAAETPDSTTVAAPLPPSAARIDKVEWQLNRADAHHYSGPRTADAAEAWLESERAHTGPTTAASVEPVTQHSVSALQCLVTADAAEHWLRATGHLPCES